MQRSVAQCRSRNFRASEVACQHRSLLMLFCAIHLKDSESEATDRSSFRNTWDRCCASLSVSITVVRSPPRGSWVDVDAAHVRITPDQRQNSALELTLATLAMFYCLPRPALENRSSLWVRRLKQVS